MVFQAAKRRTSFKVGYLLNHSGTVLSMAFISSHRCSLASNLWPEDLGNLILRRNRLGSNIGVVSVPRTVEGMLSWASVERDPTHHERPDALCLVYQEALPNIQPISFHLYGFLHNFKL